MLDNREISLLIWLTLFLAWAISQKKIRRALLSVVKAAFKPWLFSGFALMLIYITSCVLFLWLVGVWDVSNLKATILWSLTAAALMVGKVVSDKEQPEAFFRSAVLGGLKISVVLEFVVQLYVFPLLVELIFVPVTALVGAMLAICDTDEKFAPVKQVLNKLLALVGFLIIGYAIYRLRSEFSEFWRLSTVLSFFHPIVLTVLFVPFLWLVAVAVAYEEVFCRLRFFVEDPKMRAFVRRQMYWNFGLRFYEVNRWWRVFMQERPAKKEAFRASMIKARFEKDHGNI